jgi:hypothetical protein
MKRMGEGIAGRRRDILSTETAGRRKGVGLDKTGTQGRQEIGTDQT